MTRQHLLSVTTPTACEIVLTRGFDAPRELVFDAWTKPELVRRWYGPRGHHLVICEIDLRVGGSWRYVVRNPAGQDMLLRGVFHEIVPPERLVSLESNVDCDASQGAETLSTSVFVEVGGQTTVSTTLLYPSQQLRDAVITSGMQRGVGESYDKLAEVLARYSPKVSA